MLRTQKQKLRGPCPFTLAIKVDYEGLAEIISLLWYSLLYCGGFQEVTACQPNNGGLQFMLPQVPYPRHILEFGPKPKRS